VFWGSSQDVSRPLVESCGTVDDAANHIIKAKDDMSYEYDDGEVINQMF
jgi:hypothetical protein